MVLTQSKQVNLLRVACTVAMFAAVPAFAQTNTAPAATGADNKPAAPNAATPGDTTAQSATKTPAPSHKMAMASHHSMHSSKTDSSQDSAVDRLNDQSFQAAEKGTSFTAPGTGTRM